MMRAKGKEIVSSVSSDTHTFFSRSPICIFQEVVVVFSASSLEVVTLTPPAAPPPDFFFQVVGNSGR